MLTRSGRKRMVSKGSGDNVAPAAKRTGLHPNMSSSAGVSSSSTESAVSTVLQNLEVVSTALVTTSATSTDPATQSDFNMETSIPSCGACNLQDITSRSIVWCTECEEGLCPECLKHHSNSKASRHHNPVPMTVFQEINQTCDQHNAEYTIYCTAHACLCCSSCIVESHIECQKIAKLANILQNTESLIAFDEIEHSLAELTDNIQRIRESRQNNLGTLSERKSQIEKEIKQTRITINTHLDKMQDDMMKQLHATEEEEIKQIGRLLNSLTEKENEIIECQAKLEKFNQTATNLKTFISMKQLEQDISSKRELFYSMIDSESFKDRELSYHAHASLQKIATDITNYGELITKKIPCNVFLKRTKNKQTKRMVPHSLCSNTTMETSNSFCGACNVQHITSISVVWCTECDEGLCPECKTYHSMLKASRYHNTVPITVYQESDVQEINQTCDIHNEKFTIYCKKHKCFCCSRCIVETHIECQKLSKLADILQSTKSSNVFFEIENSFADITDNIQRIRENRQNNLRKLSETKSQIEKEIKQTRNTINNHLDIIQDNIMKKLQAAEEEEIRQICRLLALLTDKEKEMSEYQRKLENIQQHVPEEEAFIYMKQLENEISNKGEFLYAIVDSESFKDRELSYHAHTSLQNIATNIKNYGEISVKKTPCIFFLKMKKNKTAKRMVPHRLYRSVENIYLKLQTSININGDNITGCCMLPDSRIVFSDYNTHTVRVFNNDGSKDFENTIFGSFDIAYINDDNTLAVTSGYRKNIITVIDIQSKRVEKQIPVDTCLFGIAVKDTKLICSSNDGILLIDPYDNSTRYIVRDTSMRHVSYVATFGENIYIANSITHSVTCYDLQGTVQWTFKNENVLKYPYSLSVDNDGKVFVACACHKNVLVISADGQQHKEILEASDLRDLHDLFPAYLYYNRSTNQLLVGNHTKGAMLFNIL